MAMHPDEIHTDAHLVARLLAGQFPRWAHLPIRPVASAGTDNALYRLGDDMVVRMPRIEGAVGSLDKEHQWLPRLAPLLPVAIPVPLAKGAPTEGYPWRWSVYRWLDGEAPTVEDHGDSRQLAADLAGFVAALQRIDPLGGPPAGRGEPLARRDEATRAAIGALHGAIDTDAVTAAWEVALEAAPWRCPPVWVHADLAPGNVLLVDQRLAAVIDFSLMGLGDPACDLAVAWNLLPTRVRDLFRARLQVDDATWARGRGWALSIALIQLPYYRDTNPALAASARHVIREVLADHRRQPTIGAAVSSWREEDEEDVPSPIDLRDPADVRTWLETAETVRPWRPQLRRCIAELLRDRLASPLCVLELGPGPGLLAETILQTCSVASYTLLDFSPPFLEMCRERVGESGVAQRVLGDFKQPDWPALVQPPYDAVVTMQAVHELRHKRYAVVLYGQVLPLLRPGGLLIVCDHMPKDDPRSRALHATDTEQHSALSAAGFEDVTTHLLIHGMYVCAGRRPR